MGLLYTNIKLIVNFYWRFFISSNVLINKFSIFKNLFKNNFFLRERIKGCIWRNNYSRTIFIFIRIFFFILINNFIGLFPYAFTRSRHISFTLTLALPLRLGSILISIVYQYNNLL